MRKLLIWDGDETLWNGTIREGDTPVLPPGRAETCEMLSERGVLQSLATFNSSENALTALHTLGLDRWFLHTRAWEASDSKSRMVAQIVAAYDLSRMADVVFLDDSDFNRGEVKAAFPEVRVGTAEELDVIIAEEFTKDVYTEEDRLRVRRYRSDQTRKQAATAYGGDYMAFLATCNVHMTIRPAVDDDVPRIKDLAVRAHRMAAISASVAETDWAEWVGTGNLFVAEVRDKYGDYGLVAFVAFVGHWVQAVVVSCRLQGRGLGSALLGWLINHHPNAEWNADWSETEYNAGMRRLFEWHGFHVSSDSTQSVTAVRVDRGACGLPSWITVSS